MKRNVFLTIVFTIFIYISLFGQNEKFTIIILKGSGLFENSNSKLNLNKALKYNIKDIGNITLYPNSSAIVYNEKGNIELGGTDLQKISSKEAYLKLNKIKSNSKTKNFLSYLNRIYDDFENNKYSYGSSVGGASRGIKNNEIYFYPIDETEILSDTLILEINFEDAKLKSNILVFNETDTVYNKMPSINKVSLNYLKPGNYFWTYKIELNGQLLAFKNSFIVPKEKDKYLKRNEVLNFKKELEFLVKNTNLSKNSSEKIMADYLLKNKLYFK